MLEAKRIWDNLQFQWNGQIGPAAIIGIGQLIALCVGGAVVWTQLTDKVDGIDSKVGYVQKAVGTLHTELATSQVDRASQSERLGRVEVAIGFVTEQIRNFQARFDSAGHPTAPATGHP